jgi:hypothetical protein
MPQTINWKEIAREKHLEAIDWAGEHQVCTEKLECLKRIETQLREQNRQLKESLIKWRSKEFPGTDQRIVVDRNYPEIV